jgi:hypothetical protein
MMMMMADPAALLLCCTVLRHTLQLSALVLSKLLSPLPHISAFQAACPIG